MISAHEKCLGVFDPTTLRCANGADEDNCLSDKQIAAVETLHRPFDFGFPLPNGVTAYPGYNYGGENQPGGMIDWVTGSHPATYPITSPSAVGRIWYYGSGYVRYFIARDPKFDPFRFDPRNFADRVRQVSELMDSTNPDLSGPSCSRMVFFRYAFVAV